MVTYYELIKTVLPKRQALEQQQEKMTAKQAQLSRAEAALAASHATLHSLRNQFDTATRERGAMETALSNTRIRLMKVVFALFLLATVLRYSNRLLELQFSLSSLSHVTQSCACCTPRCSCCLLLLKGPNVRRCALVVMCVCVGVSVLTFQADALTRDLASEEKRWRASLSELRGDLACVVGDVCLTVACVVFGTPYRHALLFFAYHGLPAH